MDARKLYEQERRAVFERAGWVCEYVNPQGMRCAERATQCAHLIPARKGAEKKYGVAVIYSRHNLAAACDLKHNSYLQLRSGAWDFHAAQVAEKLKGGER